jgi:hypothetical protein
MTDYLHPEIGFLAASGWTKSDAIMKHNFKGQERR